MASAAQVGASVMRYLWCRAVWRSRCRSGVDWDSVSSATCTRPVGSTGPPAWTASRIPAERNQKRKIRNTHGINTRSDAVIINPNFLLGCVVVFISSTEIPSVCAMYYWSLGNCWWTTIFTLWLEHTIWIWLSAWLILLYNRYHIYIHWLLCDLVPPSRIN